jgi:hypothetical protein
VPVKQFYLNYMLKASSILALLSVVFGTTLIALERHESTYQIKQAVYSGNVREFQNYTEPVFLGGNGLYGSNYFAMIPIPEIVLSNLPTITIWTDTLPAGHGSLSAPIGLVQPDNDTFAYRRVQISDGILYLQWKFLVGTNEAYANDYMSNFTIVVTYEDSPAIAAAPFRILSTATTNQMFSLKWQTTAGRKYGLDASTNLTAWIPLFDNLTATGSDYTFSTNANKSQQYFRVYRTP